MQNWKATAEDAIRYWNEQPTDNPNSLNGFDGTWNITDHDLIPNSLQDFVSEMFYSATRLDRVPMANINELLNDVWDGPGSMPKLIVLMFNSRSARQKGEEYVFEQLEGYDYDAAI